jgi:hypothetical protein
VEGLAAEDPAAGDPVEGLAAEDPVAGDPVEGLAAEDPAAVVPRPVAEDLAAVELAAVVPRPVAAEDPAAVEPAAVELAAEDPRPAAHRASGLPASAGPSDCRAAGCFASVHCPGAWAEEAGQPGPDRPRNLRASDRLAAGRADWSPA